ncbi:ATP-binding cassette domain-containing protein [Syntrophomonas palmitatica]|uniref:ATP-binding cassette domain-containing protein n=1 Tax=Syntrophomonas palmitatica TaxID=402877 RepID=UPI0006CF6EAE|nr:ATP-binding cassette domain-containing protein [Syntrophomonas palmitatica]
MNSVLRFEDLRRYFEGGDGRYVMETGNVPSGSVLTLKGESGSGKSTLLKTLARLLEAQGGTVYLNEQEWLGFSPQEWRTKVHYVSQKPVIFKGTMEDNLKIPFRLKSLQDKILDINKRNFTWMN